MKIRSTIENGLLCIVSISIAIMTLLAFWLVVARYVITNQNPHLQSLLGFIPERMFRFIIFTTITTEECLRLALIWVGLLGAAYVFSIKQHLAFGLINELFCTRFPSKGKGLNIFLSFIIIVFSALVLVWGGWMMVQKNVQQLSPVMLLSMGYVYSILPLTGVLICIFEFINIYESVIKKPDSYKPDDFKIKTTTLD